MMLILKDMFILKDSIKPVYLESIVGSKNSKNMLFQ